MPAETRRRHRGARHDPRNSGIAMTTATKDQETTPSYAGAEAPAAGQATGLLIIGASQSGVQLAGSLRALGFDEHITLLGDEDHRDRKSTRLNSSHVAISYAVFCVKKKIT